MRERRLDLVDYSFRKQVNFKADTLTDREIAHLKFIELAEQVRPMLPIIRWLIGQQSYPELQTDIAGISYKNPLGIAAGFVKNAEPAATELLAATGVGHIEFGSVTKRPFAGNPRPRIFGDPQTNSLINRMGFPGEGTTAVIKNLHKLPPVHQRDYRLIANVSASKPSFEANTVVPDITHAFSDMVMSRAVDGIVINISSPNTDGVRGLAQPEMLDELLSAIDAYRKVCAELSERPYGIKLSPDIYHLHHPEEGQTELNNILEVVMKHNVSWLGLTNTASSHDVRRQLQGQHRSEAGGISGQVLTQRALATSQYAYRYLDDELPIIRSGGVMTTEDVIKAIEYGGASLVQVYTALVDSGTSRPSLVARFNMQLAKRVRNYGFDNISQLRGIKA